MRRLVVLSALVTGLFCCGLVLADDEHPIAKQVKEKLKDPAKPFTLGVRLKVKEGMGAKLEEAFAATIKESRKEKGCMAYDLNKSTEDETTYVIYERWASLEALDAHLKKPHVEKLLSTVHDYIEGQPDLKVFLPVGE